MYRHKDDDGSNYVLDESDDDEDSIGSWEAEYASMYKEEVMIITDDDTVESEEEKPGEDVESKLEHGSDDDDDEEGVDMDDEEAHTQDDPDDDRQSVEELVVNRPTWMASGRGIDRLEPTIGGKTHDNKTGMHFLLFEKPKEERWSDECYRKTVNKCFT